ncbi:asparagine synthase (glutamine-hydrolyzing) [Labedaea rhizosphaerae]|uniref:asparagine synthase (glutamine-hydrolyzing) n=1 Tax=Labedaea rhizosphaerae TaxID=598644 RepID=A0A4R6SFN8_LABRH|nr:asparagine synthase (glutamine-hydrolyzing) [Labedaea rhizosphaerae]TDQ00445.1 asparagine synthase (glutamine-hydrolysing) [Labedaea rhizosphaerae]
MCGITGWVNYERDLASARPTLQAMTDTMICRGPDEEGIFVDGHAGLGHRRLAVIDIEGGKQPMTAEGVAPVAITYSGEVYNFTELRAELEGHGHVFRTKSDTEVVLHAYLQWGTAFVDHLNGMYAFAIWDARTQELLLVRDRMGVKPLYYADTREGVVFGSEMKAILASGLVPPVVDLDGMREVFASIKTPGTAIFKGVNEVRPGHFLRVRREGVTEHRYWALEADEHTDDLPTTIERIRELLDDIVARQVVADVPLCTLLSGGLDSSAITALANRVVTAAGGDPVRSFSVDFAGLADSFVPDELRSTPDAPYAHDVAAFAGTTHSDVVLNAAHLMDPATRVATVIARDTPNSADIDNSMYLLFKAIREHSTVALSGEAADEVFGGYAWFHDENVVNGTDFPWLVALHNVDGSGYLNPDLEAKLDLGTYRADNYAEALAGMPRLEGETGLERRMREISYLHLTRFVQILLDRKDRMSMAVGLEVRVPFCDHRLVQYVFNTPWAMKTFDGREKSLLRAAVKDVLPTSVLERVKSPFPVPQEKAYLATLQDEVGKLLADPQSAPMLKVINEQTLGGMTQAPPEAGLLVRDGLESALAGHEWATRYDVVFDL